MPVELINDGLASHERAALELLHIAAVRSLSCELGVPIVVLKGLSISRLYPPEEVRVAGDIDILVEDPGGAFEQLLASGYELVDISEPAANVRRRYRNHHHLPPLESTAFGLTIEVHRRPGWCRWGSPPSWQQLLAASEPAPHLGAEVYLPSPAAVLHLAAAAFWQDYPAISARAASELRYLRDVTDRSAVAQLSREWGSGRLLEQTLRFVDRLAVATGREERLLLPSTRFRPVTAVARATAAFKVDGSPRSVVEALTRRTSSRPSLPRRLVDVQMKWSARFDRALPAELAVDGCTTFRDTVTPRYLPDNALVFDIGGGSVPAIPAEVKRRRRLTVVGLDIDGDELLKAPHGGYDRSVEADVTTFRGDGDADVVICQSVLEHVRDNRKTFEALATIVRPGGRVLLFTPSRHALFARLNRVLPERLKRSLLFWVFPEKSEGHDGFPARYDRCSVAEFTEMAHRNGFDVEELHTYYRSGYFVCFFPLHAATTLLTWLRKSRNPARAAEAFGMVLRMREGA